MTLSVKLAARSATLNPATLETYMAGINLDCPKISLREPLATSSKNRDIFTGSIFGITDCCVSAVVNVRIDLTILRPLPAPRRRGRRYKAFLI